MAASCFSSSFLQLVPVHPHPHHPLHRHQLQQLQKISLSPPRFCVPRASADDDKSLELMRKFSEQYARRSGTYFCVDKGVTAVVIKGLAEHKETLGAPLCPCRHYDDKEAEVQQGFWNCPCVPMRERKECHCMLFLTEDNDFAGKEQEITIDEIKDLTANF